MVRYQIWKDGKPFLQTKISFVGTRPKVYWHDRFQNSKVPRFWGSNFPVFQCSKVLRFKGSKVQRFKGSGSKVHRFRGSKVHWLSFHIVKNVLHYQKGHFNMCSWNTRPWLVVSTIIQSMWLSVHFHINLILRHILTSESLS